MASQVREINCKKCGAPLELQNPASRTVRCEYCGSVLDLTKPEYEVMGVFRRRTLPAGIRVGMPATFEGIAYHVRGAIGYVGDGSVWFEFMLVGDQGQVAWLEYDEGDFALFHPFRPKQPVDPNTVGTTLDLDGQRHMVLERGKMRVCYLEGELSWRLKKDQVINYLDAQKVGIEWTAKEVEYFTRRKLGWSEVQEAFGGKLQATASRREVSSETESSLQGVVAFVIILAIIIFLVIVLPKGSGSSSSSGYSTGGRTSWGGGTSGGFSGGK